VGHIGEEGAAESQADRAIEACLFSSDLGLSHSFNTTAVDLHT
jgi:hypothetical protein